MGQIAIFAVLLAAILALLAEAPKRFLRKLFETHPRWMLAVPVLLTGIFCGSGALAGAFSLRLALLVLAYTTLPVLSAYARLDFLTILFLWLPLEFSAGASLVPRAAQGFLHSTAYGIAILLALIIFTGFRPLPGMKYNLPSRAADYWLPFAAFAICAPILALGGIAIGFIPPIHAPVQSTGRMLSAAGLIFVGTALPEEILFRSLIQNLLMRRFGSTARVLFIAAFIFGCAHLDNGPQPLPNWRYMILATIAGVAYGIVFGRASSVVSSATLHMLVDWTKHFFF
jgi:membrane protease YdiL (CAAX protease family)